MSMLKINKIEMEYTPSITIEKVKEAIRKHMPDHKIFWPAVPILFKLVELVRGDSFIVKKRWTNALGIVSVKHKEAANSTVITYYTMVRVGGPILYFVSAKKLIDRIDEALHTELPNMVR